MRHVVNMGNNEMHIKFENFRGRDHLGHLCIGWRIILKWILKKEKFKDVELI
jgi:hypothetical protein